MRNIGLAVMEKMTAPELQIYQARPGLRRSTAHLDLPALYRNHRPGPGRNLQPLQSCTGDQWQNPARQPPPRFSDALRHEPEKPRRPE